MPCTDATCPAPFADDPARTGAQRRAEVSGRWSRAFRALVGHLRLWRLAVRELFPASEASWRIPTLLLFSGFGMAAGGWIAGLLYIITATTRQYSQFAVDRCAGRAAVLSRRVPTDGGRLRTRDDVKLEMDRSDQGIADTLGLIGETR
jgi:hypothetical protein